VQQKQSVPPFFKRIIITIVVVVVVVVVEYILAVLMNETRSFQLHFNFIYFNFYFNSIFNSISILTNPYRRRSILYDRPDPSSQFRLAIGSYVEQYSNSVQIVKKHSSTTSTDDLESQLYQACEFDHPYPCTKISWSPDAHNQGGKDLLATTGDYLRLWNFTDDESITQQQSVKHSAISSG
jgi:hypothetical protein